jgi:hypothetical protein
MAQSFTCSQPFGKAPGVTACFGRSPQAPLADASNSGIDAGRLDAVSLKSRPRWRYVKRSWSGPRRWSTVAWKSRTWTGILDDVVGEIVGLAVDRAALAPPPAIHMREAARVMVAAVVLSRQAALGIDRAAELAAQMMSVVIEHAARS